ncbi:MAG: methyltransferase domain-containing protein [Maritimibacter sp.]|nr:methyltransferase domain-containing protein [Maritimibacter sp.]
MHAESKDYMEAAFRKHAAGRAPGLVLDVGAGRKRGFHRRLWEAGGWTYHGLDLAEGPNVDVIPDDPWHFPVDPERYDAVISGQMLEHNEFFWLTFLEMARVLKPGGLMIHIAPSRGIEHRDPQDCWRFYRDGMTALAKWSGLDCIETTTDWAPEHFAFIGRYPRHTRRVAALKQTMRRAGTDWGDTLGVFVKTKPTGEALGMDYIRQFAARLPREATGGETGGTGQK